MNDDDDLARRYGGFQKKHQHLSSWREDVAGLGARGGDDPPTVGLTGGAKKKKGKFVSLLDAGTRDELLPGRHKCDCQASKHKLIGNCTRCGRVVCQQEGPGPCFFCSAPVPNDGSGPIVPARLESIGEMISGVDPKLLKPKLDFLPDAVQIEALRRAEEHKNKLLEYERNSEQRTRVIDDEMDYFAAESNVWLTPEQRKELMKKAHEVFAQKHAGRSGRGVRVTIDFAGRQVVQHDDGTGTEGNLSGSMVSSDVPAGERAQVRPSAVGREPKYEPSPAGPRGEGERKKHGWLLEPMLTRVQDREMMEMSDDGWCLSLHQPWAALLVAGVKRHEGRSWYSNHRGRLWIASTSKPVSPSDVTEMERFYRMHYGSDVWASKMSPSESYVPGCLLGCVDVVDVLSQEEYKQRFPFGESSSPFVFVCANARRLKVHFPIRGKHKIYQLDKDIHEAARRNLIQM